MKVLRAICLSILIALFLISDPTYAQNPARESYDKGMAYAVQGKFTKAKVEFENILKVDPFYGPAKYGLETIKDVLAQKIKTETAIHWFKGISYYLKGQYDRAIRDYTKATEINPKFALAHINRGITYYRKGQVDWAILDYTKALEINPKLVQAYIRRGGAYLKKDQYDWVIRDCTKAIKINPKDPVAYLQRGFAYRDKGQLDRAILDYTKAIEINPMYATAYRSRGYVYFFKLGNKVKGCADWKKVCELGRCRNYNARKRKGDCT